MSTAILTCEQIVRVALGEPVKREGAELLWRCPRPERHTNGDAHPSFKVNPQKNTWACFVCGVGGTAWQLAAFLAGLEADDKPRVTRWLKEHGFLNPAKSARKRVPPPEQRNTATLTLAQYAGAKKLPPDFLRSLGLADTKYQGAPAIRIPYLDCTGAETCVRFRTALVGDNRFRWRKGSKLGLYGVWRSYTELDYRILVEGESDCHTLWHLGFRALGIPGAGNWNEERDASHFDGVKKIYVLIEPDKGGATLQAWLAKSRIRDRAYLIALEGFKDPSALYLDNPSRFRERFTKAIESAVHFPHVIREQDTMEKARLWGLCKRIAALPDILGAFVEAIRSRGVVGEPRTVKLLYLVLNTRFLGRPVSVALKGPSSCGKSFLADQVSRFFPESAVYKLTAMSERVLAYTEADLRHRFLVLFEAAGMSGDFASYLIRSLLSEGRLIYEVVEKTAHGLRPRRIEKEGPTGLLVTTTAIKLHPENETRLFSLRVTDTKEQTKEVLLAIAADSQGKAEVGAWHALQRWLEYGEHRVTIPFARQLAAHIPPIAVRLRRDFSALLALIKGHAILHQASRERDAKGQLIAILEDYSVVRELVNDVLSEGVDAAVTTAIRETVDAVKSFVDAGDEGISITKLAAHLKLDKSATSRRVADAVHRGYLRNLEDGKGRPARLVIGDPLPANVEVLPGVEVLQCCSQNGEVNTPSIVRDERDLFASEDGDAEVRL